MAIREPEDPASTPPSTVRAERNDRSHWNWLLILPLLATLIPPLYNRENPRLFDIPFFYWYQLAAIAIGVSTTLIVYRKTRA
ncbi:MAG: hypothetical protein QOH75_1588 [Actinomycetota bacterium]|nr:hypothetical protein [Actinomycetota bacterium]MDQ1671139.1 hypothetical protein [Actinomycetota bacterium]